MVHVYCNLPVWSNIFIGQAIYLWLRDLITLKEGIKRTVDSYSHLRAENQLKRVGPSKASVLLGSGRGTKRFFCIHIFVVFDVWLWLWCGFKYCVLPASSTKQRKYLHSFFLFCFEFIIIRSNSEEHLLQKSGHGIMIISGTMTFTFSPPPLFPFFNVFALKPHMVYLKQWCIMYFACLITMLITCKMLHWKPAPISLLGTCF